MKPAPSLTNLKPKLENAFSFAQVQVENLITQYPDFFPLYSEGGKWKHEGEVLDELVRGFPGRHDVAVLPARR